MLRKKWWVNTVTGEVVMRRTRWGAWKYFRQDAILYNYPMLKECVQPLNN